MLRNLIFALAAPFLMLSLAAEELTLEQAKAEHAAADKLLNVSYAKAKSTLPEHLFAELQEDQRSWLSYRDYRSLQAAGFDGGAEEGKEKSTVEYWTTLASITEERVRIIEGWMKHDSFAHEWEGIWSDGEGGHLAIFENAEGQFAFTFDVVRGPTYHVGGIGGNAQWNGSSARFSVTSEGEDGETWLTFLKRGIRFEVIGENTSPYHGARAYFDGHYVRVAELTAEDRKAILENEELNP